MYRRIQVKQLLIKRWSQDNLLIHELASKFHPMNRHEHSACLNALRCSAESISELSTEDKRDCMLYESTALHRFEEKSSYLQKLREHYFAQISSRYHDVPPSIDYFVTQIWKKKLITMLRQRANDRYRMTTAISIQPSNCVIKSKTIHQEHLGYIPQIMHEHVDYLRDSFANLMKAYNQRKNTHSTRIIKEKVNDLIKQHNVDFVVPISILKLLLSHKSGWSFTMTVNDSNTTSSTKEIIFDKPLPVAYMSGRERYKKGAKYLLYSCLNRNTLNVYNRNEQLESKTLIDSNVMECHSNINNDLEYKVSSCDEFIKKYAKSETLYENMTFTIFDVTGCDDSPEETGETFKLLVPAKQAAFKNGENGEVIFFNYSPKIEYQAEYGAEVMTKEELIDEWCELFFKPNTITNRVRFDCKSGKVIDRQSFPLNVLENELNAKYGIETQQLLQKLWQALQTFVAFPVGDYLLQSDSKQPTNVNVFEKSNSAETLSISQVIKKVKFERDPFDKVEWQPIDDKIVIEIHNKYQILPCAFPHSHYLHQHGLKRIKNKQTKQMNCTKKAKQRLKICPKDDSRAIIERLQSRKQLHKNQVKLKTQNKNRLKLKRKRDRKKAGQEAKKIEVDELNAERQFMLETRDQYNTATVMTHNESAAAQKELANNLIGTRGGTKFTNSQEIQQNVRRSNRMSSNK
ncbi:uncharacterized protein LOC116339454 isoform X2 [Contarinia nasturtii]|uniref:uncharacterized protein LOC116339454 isoform X2 n=1 Tax=Contarinia nasturtii TaxID=265458 RepID=UPI0012D49DA7|nr:uncharacterized protein LOC116339454 isoform X2 [Contarinia nasturtii]